MKSINRVALITASLAVCTSVLPLRAADTSERQTTAATGKTLGHVERATKLIGKDIQTSNGQRAGKLEDLVVDLTSGHILYAVIDRERGKAAVAPQVFTSSESKTLRANVTREQLNQAPEFTKDIASDEQISKADFVSKIYQHFGQNAWWTGTQPSSQGAFQNVHRASKLAGKLAGMDVKNVSNEKVGDVKDLAVDLSAGRIVYVVLSPDSSLGLGKNLYALPPDAFTPGADRSTIVSNIDKQKLASAPHFTNENWEQLSDAAWASQIYQYYGKQAYFQTPGSLQPTGRDRPLVFPSSKDK